MKKVLLSTLIVLVSVGWAVAQNPGTQSTSPTPGAQSPTSPGAQPGAPSQQQPAAPGEAGQQPGLPGDQAAQAGQDTSAVAAGNSVEGCLGGAAGNFTIIDKAGTTYRLDIPAGADTSKLNQHIGEEVRVTGAMSNAKQSNGADASSASAGAAGASSSQPSIAVSKIDKVADKCTTNTSTPNNNH